MRTPIVIEEREGPLALIGLNDPERRNALGVPMFDALESALGAADRDGRVSVVMVHGHGPAFCAGFDLSAAAARPELLGEYILRLSGVIRRMRRMRPVVVVAVRGAAIAGGCALLSVSDLAVVAPDAKIGYPVHRLGISPAVSMPTLMTKIRIGPARRLQVTGALIDGREAAALGLASHLAASAESVEEEARALGRKLAGHGRAALETTKAWLNELDGSLDDDRVDGPADDTAQAALSEEAASRLHEVWTSRSRSRR